MALTKNQRRTLNEHLLDPDVYNCVYNVIMVDNQLEMDSFFGEHYQIGETGMIEGRFSFTGSWN